MTTPVKKPKKVTKKTTKKAIVKLTMNQYDIPMLEIPTKARPLFISVKKALAILESDIENLEVVVKHGRDLNRVEYGDGKSFLVGQIKIDAVVTAKKMIEKAVA